MHWRLEIYLLYVPIVMWACIALKDLAENPEKHSAISLGLQPDFSSSIACSLVMGSFLPVGVLISNGSVLTSTGSSSSIFFSSMISGSDSKVF